MVFVSCLRCKIELGCDVIGGDVARAGRSRHGGAIHRRVLFQSNYGHALHDLDFDFDHRYLSAPDHVHAVLDHDYDQDDNAAPA